MSEEHKHIRSHGNEIFFHCEVNDESILEFSLELCRIDKDLRSKYMEPPSIYIHINSGGGDLHSGLAAHDSIRNCKSRIVTICNGLVASSSALMYLAGDERWITKNSYIMIHQLESEMNGKFQDMKDEIDMCEKLMKNILSISLTYTNIPQEKMDKFMTRDKLIGPKKCLKYGISHKIL